MTKGITIPKLACLQCGHEWRPMVPKPTVCPRCKSYKWDEAKVAKEAATA